MGLVHDRRWEKFSDKRDKVEAERQRLEDVRLTPTKEVRAKMESMDTPPISQPTTLAELLQRPEVGYDDLTAVDPQHPQLPEEVTRVLEIEMKYRGYIEKQMAQVRKFRRMEDKKIPSNFDYSRLEGLSVEAREKLSKIRPESIGQAGRITGVTPADVSTLLVYLEQRQKGS